MSLIAAVAAALVVLVAHAILVAAIARRLGVAVDHVSIFIGPRVLRRRVLGVRVELGALPLSSWVTFARIDPDDPDGPTALERASRPRRAAIALLPWVVIVTPSALLLAPFEAATAFLLGGPRFLEGGVLFWSSGVAFVDAIARAFASEPPAALAGLTVAALASMNLLPFPGLSGGQLVEAILGRRLPRPLAAVPGLAALGWVAAIVIHLA